MIDPEIERQFADCQELLVLWREFHDFFSMAVKGEGITHDKEAEFLELKSQIAMLHDSFMDALTKDQNIGQEVLGIVSRSITLKHLNRQSVADIKKMEIEWHESYLLLNDTIGLLDEKRTELAGLSASQVRAGKAAGAARQHMNNILFSTYTKVAVVLVILAGAGIFVPWQSFASTPALVTPYRMGMLVVRMIAKDTPWGSIIATDADRLSSSAGSWPGSTQPFEEKRGADKASAINALARRAPELQASLDKSIEFREETIKNTAMGQEGEATVHTFRFPDVDTASSAESAASPLAKEMGQGVMSYQYKRNHNVLSIMGSNNSGFLNAVKVNIYDKKSNN